MNLITKQAIDFTAKAVMPDDKIIEFNLKQYARDKCAILFFYPRDFTFVCPTEIISLHNRIPQFLEKNTEIIGISTDSEFCHSHWRNVGVNKGGIDKISFPLIADDSHSISESYGVLHNNSIALRATFIIDDNFVIRHQSINDLSIGRNVDELLRIIDAIKHHQSHGEVCPAGWMKGDPAMEASQHGIEDYLKSHIDNLEKSIMENK